MSDGTSTDRLAQLLSRWESDPSSRVFLQVAEEYRHRGRTREALAVLERGLKEHPGYLSALVAKGRCHLELGEPDVARGVLERVVKQDATQMVANKLLVRAYLETGDPGQARERLDLYSLLNDSDPEIEELRRRILAMDQPPQAAQAARPDGFDLFDLAPPAAPPSPHAAADIFALDAPAPEPPALSTAPAEEPSGDLFPGLSSRESLHRYLSGLAAEGLFAVEMPAAPVPQPAAAEPERIFEPEPFLAPEPIPVAPAAAEEAEEIEEAPVALQVEEAALDETSPWVPAEEPAPVAFDEEPVPVGSIETVTLGELYLRQGHLEEAERIFREVLRHEANNVAAQQGLAQIARQTEAVQPVTAVPASPEPAPAGPFDAGRLLAGFDPAAVPAGVSPANARKAFVLSSYLQRLREGSQRNVS